MKIRLLLLSWAILLASFASAERMPYPIDTVHGQAVYRYTVEKSIGLYRIGVNFGVTQEEIIQLNPSLRERGLRYEEVILVPVKDTVTPVKDTVTPIAATIPEAMPVVPVMPKDTTVTAQDSAFHIALLLPLQSDMPKRDAIAERFVEFYEGVLVALYRLPKDQHYVLHVYDIGRSNEVLNQLLTDSALTAMNLIIGPAYPSQVTLMSAYAQQKAIPMLVPFTDKVEGLDTNPYLYQFNPTEAMKAKAFGEYLEGRIDAINCVMVDNTEADIPVAIRAIQQEIRNRKIPYTRVSIHDIMNDSIHLALKEGVENILILNTEKYANTQVLLPHIQAGMQNYEVTLMSQYSWQTEKIAFSQLYATVFDADNEEGNTAYEAIYNQYFHHDPISTYPRYDKLGYDLTRQLIALLTGTTYEGIQSTMQFEQKAQGGYINTYVQIIRK